MNYSQHFTIPLQFDGIDFLLRLDLSHMQKIEVVDLWSQGHCEAALRVMLPGPGDADYLWEHVFNTPNTDRTAGIVESMFRLAGIPESRYGFTAPSL